MDQQRALIYARVSYDDRKNEARNLAGQIADGQKYCQEKGYSIVAELAEDDRGASGASWDLPMLNQALDMARAGQADVLVVRELDRFARGLAKQLVVEGEFRRHGVGVEYILAQYDDTPEGKLNKHIRAVIADFEREKISQRMVRGRRLKVKSGKVLLHGKGKAPYGYRLQDGQFVVFEPEARIVRIIFTWYMQGDENGKRLTPAAIARRLTEMKVPTWADTRAASSTKVRGEGEWCKATIRKYLANETYAGLWHYGKNGTEARNPRAQWLAVEVPAIIDRETWERAQKQRGRNKTQARRNTKRPYLVSRRVVCGQCNSKMFAKTNNWGNSYYICSRAAGRLAGKDCNLPYFRSDHVDAAVWEKTKEWLQDPEVLEQSLEEIKAKLAQKHQPLHDRLTVVDDLLTENRGKLEKLLDLYLAGDFPREVLADRKARLETTIASLEEERAYLAATLESQDLSDDQIKTIVDLAREVAGGLKEAERDFGARRRIIDDLHVKVRLVIEEGIKVAYVSWLVSDEEEERAPIEPTDIRIRTGA